MTSTQECATCRLELSRSEFYELRDGSLKPTCEKCYRLDYYAAAHAQTTNRLNRTCDFCGQTMTLTQRRADEPRVYCSRPCKNKAKNQRAKLARLAAMPERSCLHCGQSMPKTMRIDAIFCTNDCLEAARNLAKRINERSETWGVAPLETKFLDRASIIKRDFSICQICLSPVDLDIDHPDPRCASIDHRVPLSQQGPNTLANLQLAHLRCNVDKADS